MKTIDIISCEELMNLLIKSNKIAEIHTLALDISERECVNGLEIIMDKVMDESTLNYRGTLLFACSVYDCSDYFLTLVSTLISGGYETSIEAYNLIIDNVDYEKIGLVDKKIAIEKLKECQRYDSLENIEIIENTIEFLNKIK